MKEYYIYEQTRLSKKIDLNDTVILSKIQNIAGVDLAYWNKQGKEYAVCCILVINYNTYEIIEKVNYIDEINIPYIPGCLAYRELPVFLEAYKKLSCRPDVIFFDGNGYLHPRHMGLASHAGVILDAPTAGVAKTYYKINNTDFVMPGNTAGAYTDIIINGEIYGRALRTHADVKPVFLSVGNKISIDTVTKMTVRLTTRESHIPMPTRLADIMSHEERRKYALRSCAGNTV